MRKNTIRVLENAPATSLKLAIKAFTSTCKASGLSKSTIDYYSYRLQALQKNLGNDCPPADVTAERIRKFVSDELNNKSKTTAHHAHVVLNVFFKWLTSEGILDENPMLRVEKPRRSQKVIQSFSAEQIEAMLDACDNTFSGLRDKAIFLVLFDCALRASELCSLNVEDVDFTENTILVREGKGGKARIVPFSVATARALSSYLTRRPDDLETDALFVSVNRNRLTRFALKDIIKKRCETAGIIGVRCSPHTFRHTAAITFLRNGADAFAVQRLLGHTTLDMTRRYCNMTDGDLAEKHRAFSPANSLQSSKQKPGKRLK